MEDNLTTKQNLVNTEIINKESNIDSFKKYLCSIKGDNGHDLTLWTLYELKQAIVQFRTQRNAEPVEYSPSLTMSNIADIKEIKCLGPEESDFSSEQKLKVQLAFPEKKNGKIYFLVENSLNNLRVHRQCKDFLWLREILGKLYPGILIPPLNTKLINDKASDELVNKRMTSYSFFINEIVNDPLLRSSKIVYDFLTVAVEKEFKLKQKSYELLQPPKTLENIRTRSGKIVLDGSIFKGKRLETSKTNVHNTISKITKLGKLIKNLISNLGTIAGTLSELNTTMQSLVQEAQEYTDNLSTIQSYKSLEKLFNGWYFNEKRKALNLKLELKQFFKYILKEYKAVDEMYVNYEKSKKEYSKARDKLTKKKEELFKKRDVKNWELLTNDTNVDFSNKSSCFEKMLPEQTKNVEEMKSFACFYGTNCEIEFNRIREQIDDLNKKMLEDMSIKNGKLTNEMMELWNSLSKISNINLNEIVQKQ